MTEPQGGREGSFAAEMELLGGSNKQPGGARCAPTNGA